MGVARRLWLLAVMVGALLTGGRCPGHPPVDGVAVVRLAGPEAGGPAGGGGGDGGGVGAALTIELTYDALAFALNDTSANIPDGPMFELLDGPEPALAGALTEAARRFERLCVLTVDGVRVPVKVVHAPTTADVLEWKRTHPTYPLPVKGDLAASASLPAGARAFNIRFPEMLGSLILAVSRPGEETAAIPLTANEVSPDFGLPVARGAGVGAGAVVETPGAASVFRRFAVLGFEHIVPAGLDHCLFVLGLFLLSPRLRPLLLQVSAFTAAHTLTLTLTSLGVIGLPSRVVEPAIAASIIVVGIENLVTRKVGLTQSAVAFAFGLLHGMGVATAFHAEGFPPGRLVPSLVAFTVGVEAGHLAVLAVAFAALGWTRGRRWYRAWVAIPLSLGIAGVAAVWLVQRL